MNGNSTKLLKQIIQMESAGEWDESDYEVFAREFPEEMTEQISIVAYLTVRNGVRLVRLTEKLDAAFNDIEMAARQRQRIWVALSVLAGISVLSLLLHTELDIVSSLILAVLSAGAGLVAGVIGGKK